MSTRGVFGVRINGKDKLMYNHSDSYESGLGVYMLDTFRKMEKERGIDWIKQRAEALQLFDTDLPPSSENQEKLKPFSDLSVSERSLNDWYCLTRHLQGELEKVLEVGVASESDSFITDSLFCEWGYIINLDDNKFEVYRGFQRRPHEKGRFAKDVMPSEQQTYYSRGPYYPCALLIEFPLDNLPSNKDFLEAVVKAKEKAAWEDAVALGEEED